jgi:DNA gyrase subunit A
MMLISNKGTLVRARAADVSIIGRNTQGVTLINIADDEKLVSVAKIAESEEEDSEDDVQSEDDSSSEVISKPKENSQSEE